MSIKHTNSMFAFHLHPFYFLFTDASDFRPSHSVNNSNNPRRHKHFSNERDLIWFQRFSFFTFHSSHFQQHIRFKHNTHECLRFLHFFIWTFAKDCAGSFAYTSARMRLVQHAQRLCFPRPLSFVRLLFLCNKKTKQKKLSEADECCCCCKKGAAFKRRCR